jgi:predicted nucleotidyltransferase
MRMKADQIKIEMLKNAPDVFKGRDIIFAYLYGSVASDQVHHFSDLDVGVYTQKLSSEACRKLELDLALDIDDVLVGAPESDVRIMNHLPLAITGKIVTDGILIYCEDEKIRIEYETKTRMAYFDFYPVIRSYQRTYLEQTQIAEKSEDFKVGLDNGID